MGSQSQQLLDKTAEWTERIYDFDLSPIGLDSEMEKFFAAKGDDCNKILYIEYSYKQIGLTEKWLKEISAKIGNNLTVRREILLQRLHGSSLSPYNQEDIEYICDSERKPIDELWVNDYYCFKIYEALNKGIPYLIGVDCSTGTNKDNNAITIINPYTCRPVAEFECSYIGETAYEQLLITLVSEHLPRGVVIIERNSVGDGIIDHLLRSKISNRLYFDKSADLVKDKMEGNETWTSILQKEASKKSFYGVFTGKKSREDMFSILARHVNEKKEDFVTHNIIRDLSRLIVLPSGKIVAGTGQDEEGNEFHDDSIMSYLIALYVYYHGNNLEVFGVTKYDPNLSPKEEKAKSLRDINPNLVNKDAIDEVKSQIEKEKKTKEYSEWEQIMREAAAKAQAESYMLHKRGLIDDKLFDNSQNDVYGYEEDGVVPLNFFSEINNM